MQHEQQIILNLYSWRNLSSSCYSIHDWQLITMQNVWVVQSLLR